jgi:putative phosphoesterase
MLLGVVSDTHNNLKNITTIINLFNQKKVDFVVHTGDITNAKTLEKFSDLNCALFGVYGNNDRDEIGLEEVTKKLGFKFDNPPLIIHKEKRVIAVFHEPELIQDFLLKNSQTDIVLHGHTHRFRKEYINNTLLFNPGESAGMVKGKNAVGIINLIDLSSEIILF